MPIVISKLNGSPPVRATLMVAEIIKLNYTSKEVNTILGDNLKPEYLEKNPLHTIPLLEDGDFILADSHAINAYLVSKYGAEKRAELYPNDLYERAIIDQRMYFDATIVFPLIRKIVIGLLIEKKPGVPEEDVKSAEEAYRVLDIYLSKNKYAAANHLTIADLSLVATISSLDAFVPVDAKYEKVHAWWNELKQTEWYQKANVPGLQEFSGFMKGAMEKNKQ